jgi:uncharacterized protein YkwD
MRRLIVFAPVLIVVVSVAATCSASSKSLPPYPRENNDAQVTDLERAHKLFGLARKENRRLQWDECMGQRAIDRAKRMFKRNFFAHRDPRTGKKPAWDLVASCHRCRYAGENLSRSYDAPEVVHQALMDSPTHRKNILNPKFTLLGVGCYENICVQLFGGF